MTATGVHGRKWMTRREYVNGGARLVCKRGTDLPHARLDPDKVRAIRANAEGWTSKQWAAHYGVHQRTIEAVRGYRNWVHVI